MKLLVMLKARKAASLQTKGDIKGAIALYAEAMAAGLDDPRYILAYTVLLLRTGEYQKSREILVKLQNSPLLNANQKITLYVNYAACMYKLGDLPKAISVLEGCHATTPCSLVYETLGYFYVEAGETEKALAFNTEAVEYDDDDSISLDNLAQTYYRLVNDKEKALEYFHKALEVKATQIDTLYFLAQYDIEAGDKEAALEKIEKALKGRFSPLNHATPDKLNELRASIEA